MSALVTTELDQGVLTVTLNCPERRNGITSELAADLLSAVESAADDSKVRVVLLRGAGGTFSVGGDVKVMADSPDVAGTVEQRADRLRRLMGVSKLLHEMHKPTIAAVDGAAAGGALSLALACDLRLAGRSAKFTTAFAKVALSGDFGGTYLLTKLVGSAKARELYLCCPVLTAEEAFTAGLLTKVVPDADLFAVATALARSLADGPALALGYMKQNLLLAETASFDACLDAEALLLVRSSQSEDHKEAARAFVEKRKPAFKRA